MSLLVGYAIIISLAGGNGSPSPATGAEFFSERVFIMSIRSVFTKVGCFIGEVILTNCDNIKNVVADLAMSIYGIVDGYGYDADQVADEWTNVYNNFNILLKFNREDGLKYWSIALLSVDGFINVTFE